MLLLILVSPEFATKRSGNVFNFCNEAVKLNGSIPLRAKASIVYDDGTVLTSVAAGVTGQHTVAFAGTDYGSIKKTSFNALPSIKAIFL
ncbi:hypothetical protein QR98_0081770 [Sarcoptes scabiei]|uniref:Uncharacterized protein n=1 Tax=Sarcoptes scabiei TaxID=52283 RepID=A0A132AF68_SARSC|nr:hypothetical protein QR98_0081770 [Sarcoptes scabiei]